MTEKGIHDSSRLKKYGIAWHTPKQHENQCGQPLLQMQTEEFLGYSW